MFAISRKYSVKPKRLILGIRREAKNRWERRVPLTPEHVERLTTEYGAKVYVQPSTKRVFPDEKYQDAGAIIHEDLSIADVIVGVKEVPIHDLIPSKTYMFFSHTHKGQPYNMSMLKSILDKKIRLIDYELMTNESDKRLVQFSKFAGYAGMIDGLHVLGHRLLALGYGSPFLAVGMSYMYRCLADARLDVTRTGQVIMDEGLPRALGPMTFVITGDGNVSRGALHVFKCLPHEIVSPNELAALSTKDYIVGKDGSGFNVGRYYSHPDEFESIFHEKIAPYSRFILNGIFWTDRFPRLLTIEQASQLAQENRSKLLTLADVSCDINGSFEFMEKSSTIDNPSYMWDPIEKKIHYDVEKPGIQIMSIDNLPTEMPLEASQYFSDALFPLVVQLAKGNENHSVLERATICSDGSLKPRFEKLDGFIQKYAKAPIKVTKPKKVLLLGSGFVARPLVDYLLEKNHQVTIATNQENEGRALSQGRSQAPVVPLNVDHDVELGSLVDASDIVVSFVPANLHPLVAEKCLEHKTHLITASYITPTMQEFDHRAKEAGLTFLNEIGLDPGIDHLTACELFDKVQSTGGKISSFTSWCGGLPAPEFSGNPLGYKFSWSPRGVLLAALNSAKYKLNNKMHDISSSELLQNVIPVSICKGFNFEGIANRDSMKYINVYNLKEDELETMFRGTLRYAGFAELMHAFVKLGCLDFSARKIDCSLAEFRALLEENLRKLNPREVVKVQSAFDWLGMSDKSQRIQGDSILDAFCSLLTQKLAYGKDERDMVVMQHEFGIKWPNCRELRTATMIAYGDQQYSAMAKTVGLPAAVATHLVLNGTIKRKGVLAPTTADIYKPILSELHTLGISFKEHSTFSEKS